MSVNRILELAIKLAAFPPLTQSDTKRTYEPWYLIHELRAELDKADVNWRALKPIPLES